MMGELELVADLVQTVLRAGVWAAQADLVSLYVALKSKPFLILAGRAGSGKQAIMSSLMQILGGSSLLQCQTMKGHVWSAGRHGNGAFVAEAQARMNSLKLLDLMEVANEPACADKVFIGCLERISPAELSLFFTETAFQVERGYVMRLPYLHLAEPMHYPPNLFLIGTMDAHTPPQSDPDLHSTTTVVEWHGGRRPFGQPSATVAIDSSGGAVFLASMIREEGVARQKLAAILGGSAPLLHRPVRRDTLIYVANAWSQERAGLFDPDVDRNLAMALEFVQKHLERYPAKDNSQCRTTESALNERVPSQIVRYPPDR